MGKESIPSTTYLRWPIVAVLVLFSIGTGALLDLSFPTVVFVPWVAVVSVLLGTLEKRGPIVDSTNRNMVASVMVLVLVLAVFAVGRAAAELMQLSFPSIAAGIGAAVAVVLVGTALRRSSTDHASTRGDA